MGLPLCLLVATLAAAPLDEPLVLREFLVLQQVGGGGRSPVFSDLLQAAWLTDTAPPTEGRSVASPDGRERAWQAMSANDEGLLQGRGLGGAYAYARVDLPAPRVALLEAPGAGYAVVNGEPRGGDPYGYGWFRIPVSLREGVNHLYFRIGRGQLRARLLPPRAALMLDLGDATLPDRRVGDGGEAMAGIVVINTGDAPRDDLWLEATPPAGPPALTKLPRLPALSLRKVPVRLAAAPPTEAGSESWRLTLRAAGETLDSAELELRVREPGASYKATFVSEIDGSVQYYGVQPQHGDGRPALFLTLHGAAVEAIGQADAYAPKTWGHLVAPTNRRPFGFDWEDWGRLDALEVLDIAAERLGTDPERVYLTGHSMGGHGAWQVAVSAPDRFAATGPSAGWVSFASYGGGARYDEADPLAAVLARAGTPSDTLALLDNLHGLGVYVLHGAADDNVPAAQAERMRQALAEREIPFEQHSEPGAGHWWDNSDEPGAACVDWPSMFDLFSRRRIPPPGEVRRVRLVTANPQITSQRAWLAIEAQQTMLAPARVDLTLEPWRRRFVGSTENVARLRLELGLLEPGEPVRIALDGGEFELPWPGERLWLRRGEEGWTAIAQPSPQLKGPARYGPFKEAFRHRMVYVYATGGAPEERAWAAAKARYDTETWQYRGNGAVDLVPDSEFDPAAEPDRSVILIGNAASHGDWAALLGDSPVQVVPGAVRLGDRELTGDDLAAWFCRPRPGSETAMVAVIAPTGPAGRQLAWTNAYFISGAAYPDLLVASAEMLTQGIAGLRAATFFTEDWSLAD